ncbi:MAG: ROK family protein [Actinomycetaceae bacterium]|nr:ROK family protein [Actinomycetaceae bacterium]
MGTDDTHNGRLAVLGADNRAHCFAFIRRHGQQSITELAAHTKLSRPTVRTHIDAMKDMGLLHETEQPSQSQGGRPAASFTINASAAYLAVFDISKHEHRYLLCDISGTIRRALVKDVPGDLSIPQREALIEADLKELAETAAVPQEAIQRFSGSVGTQVSSAGAILEYADNVALLDDNFAKRLHAPVTLENDLKAASYAEHHIGCAQGVDNLVYTLAWHRVAAGIVLGGKIHRGFHDLAGELNLITSTDPTQDFAQDWNDWPTFLQVLKNAEGGSTKAQRSVKAFCQAAGTQTAFLAMSIDPEMIVLGGPLVHRSPYFVEEITSVLDQLLGNTPGIDIRLSQLRSWGPALGAALKGMEALETALIGAPSLEHTLRNTTDVEIPLPVKH